MLFTNSFRKSISKSLSSNLIYYISPPRQKKQCYILPPRYSKYCYISPPNRDIFVKYCNILPPNKKTDNNIAIFHPPKKRNLRLNHCLIISLQYSTPQYFRVFAIFYPPRLLYFTPQDCYISPPKKNT